MALCVLKRRCVETTACCDALYAGQITPSCHDHTSFLSLITQKMKYNNAILASFVSIVKSTPL